ncbi:hypothetical protein EON65_54625 [archaeon]|nr:MAG: hypothetical protein EON65_54625 [archaeon]
MYHSGEAFNSVEIATHIFGVDVMNRHQEKARACVVAVFTSVVEHARQCPTRDEGKKERLARATYGHLESFQHLSALEWSEISIFGDKLETMMGFMNPTQRVMEHAAAFSINMRSSLASGNPSKKVMRLRNVSMHIFGKPFTSRTRKPKLKKEEDKKVSRRGMKRRDYILTVPEKLAPVKKENKRAYKPRHSARNAARSSSVETHVTDSREVVTMQQTGEEPPGVWSFSHSEINELLDLLSNITETAPLATCWSTAPAAHMHRLEPTSPFAGMLLDEEDLSPLFDLVAIYLQDATELVQEVEGDEGIMEVSSTIPLCAGVSIKLPTSCPSVKPPPLLEAARVTCEGPQEQQREKEYYEVAI